MGKDQSSCASQMLILLFLSIPCYGFLFWKDKWDCNHKTVSIENDRAYPYTFDGLFRQDMNCSIMVPRITSHYSNCYVNFKGNDGDYVSITDDYGRNETFYNELAEDHNIKIFVSPVDLHIKLIAKQNTEYGSFFVKCEYLEYNPSLIREEEVTFKLVKGKPLILQEGNIGIITITSIEPMAIMGACDANMFMPHFPRSAVMFEGPDVTGTFLLTFNRLNSSSTPYIKATKPYTVTIAAPIQSGCSMFFQTYSEFKQLPLSTHRALSLADIFNITEQEVVLDARAKPCRMFLHASFRFISDLQFSNNRTRLEFYFKLTPGEKPITTWNKTHTIPKNAPQKLPQNTILMAYNGVVHIKIGNSMQILTKHVPENLSIGDHGWVPISYMIHDLQPQFHHQHVIGSGTISESIGDKVDFVVKRFNCTYPSLLNCYFSNKSSGSLVSHVITEDKRVFGPKFCQGGKFNLMKKDNGDPKYGDNTPQECLLYWEIRERRTVFGSIAQKIKNILQ